MKLRVFLIALLAIGATAFGQNAPRDLREAAEQAEERLDEARQEFGQLLSEINQERVPLVQERDRLQSEANQLRREAEAAARVRNQRQVSFSELEGRVESLRNTNSYLTSVLSDYRERFNSQLLPSERAIYGGVIRAAQDAQTNAELTDAEKFLPLLDVVESSIVRSKRMVGGYTFPGAAVVEGEERPGTFVAVGPVGFFASQDGAFAGDLDRGTQQIQVDARPDFTPGIAAFTQGTSGTLPIDSTLGDARRAELTEETLMEHIAKGKIVGYIIITLLFIAAIIFIIKAIQIMGVRQVNQKDLNTILEKLKAGDKDGAMDYAKGIKGPAGSLLVSAVEHCEDDRDLLEESLYERIITTQPRLESMLPMVAVIAATAPLLGLLGTVTGMINTFKLITVFGTGDARSLSTGISEALVTTELGLIVAISALIGHAILNRMAKGVVTSMEQTAVSFINAITEMREKSRPAA